MGRARPGEPGSQRVPPKAIAGRARAGRSERCRLTNNCCCAGPLRAALATVLQDPAPRGGGGPTGVSPGLCAEERGLAATPPRQPFLLPVICLPLVHFLSYGLRKCSSSSSCCCWSSQGCEQKANETRLPGYVTPLTASASCL